MCGWNLEHENFIHESLFLSGIWQIHKIFTPQKFLAIGILEISSSLSPHTLTAVCTCVMYMAKMANQ